MIGVLPLVDYDRESIWMRPGYLDGLEEAGAIPVILPLTDDTGLLRDLASRLDGVLFSGGPDVDPRLYESKPPEAYLATNPLLSPERDGMEIPLLREMIRLDKPVLGICRGIQLINVALGGTLWHDLPSEHPSGIDHWSKENNGRFKHQDRVLPGTPLAELLDALASEAARGDGGSSHGEEPCHQVAAEARQGRPHHRVSELARTSQLLGAYQFECTPQLEDDGRREADGSWVIGVNSYHHQAVREVAPELEVMAVSEDGIVEGVWRPESRFLWGIQWHPELLHRVDARSRAIFSAFVTAARAS